MNITCCICADLLLPSHDVYYTPCGHFFHLACVQHWLERSPTCPQCRSKTTRRTIHRAYFTFSNTAPGEQDVTSLHNKIDSLNLKLMLRDKDIDTYGKDNATLKKQTAGLRAEVKKLEMEIQEHRSAIYAFKEQIKFLKGLNADADIVKQEVVRLRKTLEKYQTIDVLVSDSQDEVKKLLSNNSTNEELITYLAVLKREVIKTHKNLQEFNAQNKSLEQELKRVKLERNNLLHHEERNRQLEADIVHCEQGKQSLTNKLQKLKNQLSSVTQKNSSEEIQRYIDESPAPKRIKTSTGSVIPATPESNATSLAETPKIREEETSPQLSGKSSNNYTIPKKESSRLRPAGSTLSILAKKPRLIASSKAETGSTEMHYDGYGGHSRLDDFPSSFFRFGTRKGNMITLKEKRRKPGDDNSKKLSRYLIDLTKEDGA